MTMNRSTDRPTRSHWPWCLSAESNHRAVVWVAVNQLYPSCYEESTPRPENKNNNWG